jgi:hypothetical protein
MSTKRIKIICTNEPDISYTRNKKLIVNKQYLGEYIELNLGSNYGVCPIYKVYEDGKLLGEYYARDFKNIEENRDSILNELLYENDN